MLKIREVKTGSNNIAVQVIYYQNRKRVVLKHIGSACNDEALAHLKLVASEFIKGYTSQLSIFPKENPNACLYVDHSHCIGFYYGFFRKTIYQLLDIVGFTGFSTKLFLDLIVMRVLEPASKLRSIELMEQYFGVVHRRQSYYRDAKQWLILKEKAQEIALSFAQSEYSCDYSLLFYDVTTLYFESFEDDELRKKGFSKDSKSQQPQILVALMVNRDGFPIAFDIFPGNTFEGHTIIPVIKAFIEKNKVPHFTVVADAAMISTENITALQKEGIHYIVGARLGNLSNHTFEQIDKNVIREDGKLCRIKTDKGSLICSYSSSRYRKDKYEMERQLIKAISIVEHPSKSKNAKFIKANNKKLEINQSLLDKTMKLLGLKGYYTDIEERVLANNEIIERYHELYKVEQAFRITKSDLQTRPIFHYKEDPIKLHMTICFIALVISRHIELKTKVSIKKFVTESKKITDARMMNTITNKEILIKGKINEVMDGFLADLKLPH